MEGEWLGDGKVLPDISEMLPISPPDTPEYEKEVEMFLKAYESSARMRYDAVYCTEAEYFYRRRKRLAGNN